MKPLRHRARSDSAIDIGGFQRIARGNVFFSIMWFSDFGVWWLLAYSWMATPSARVKLGCGSVVSSVLCFSDGRYPVPGRYVRRMGASCLLSVVPSSKLEI